MNMQHVGTIAPKVVDVWTWWRNALAGNFGPIHSEPEWGYYRTRAKDGPWEPVAIWQDEEGNWLAYRNGREVQADAVWTWCCRHPIEHAAYERAMAGGGWADDEPVVAAQIAARGHNSGDVSELEVIRDQIEAAKAGADAYAKITDDETQSKAQSLRSRLNELSRDADKRRAELKAPHLEAGKAIDKDWQPLVKDAKAAADAIAKAMSAWETEKLRRAREAERKAEEVRRAAEASQQPEAPEQAPAATIEAPAPVQTQIRGSYGKAASVKAKIVVTKITDPAALFGFLNGHPELDDCMFKLAQRAIDAGRTVPGIETDEIASVR